MILLRNIRTPDGSGADILIDGRTISKITPPFTCPAGGENVEILDCSGKYAVPGFINSHTHAAMALLRGIREDVSLLDWLKGIWEIEKGVDDEFVYHGTRLACLEMIKTGTTVFNDHYFHHEAALRAAREMGITANPGYVLLDIGGPDLTQRQKEGCMEAYQNSLEWSDGSKFMVAVHSPFTVSEQLLGWAADFARSHGLTIHIHLAEHPKEEAESREAHGGLSSTEYLERMGVLDCNVIAAHSLYLTPKDIEILAAHRVSCVHNINANTKLASGYRFLYNELRDAGVNVCMGTDGPASSNNLDILESMKTTALFQKAWRMDPAAMPLRELLDMATVNGARAIGSNGGKLEEGADADILIVDTDSTFFISPGSFLANFIYAAHSDCISDVIARGRFVMRDRHVEGEEEVLAGARELLKRIRK